LVFCDEIWIASSVLCALCVLACRGVLLEDESDGQPAIALKNDNLVIILKKINYLLSNRHCDVIGSKVVTCFFTHNLFYVKCGKIGGLGFTNHKVVFFAHFDLPNVDNSRVFGQL